MTIISNLPKKLKETGLFCCWKYEDRGRKPTKVLYNPRTGGRGQSNNPATFSTLAVAESVQSKYEGLGVGIFGSLGAIDIDHCIDENGEFSELAAEIVQIMDAYTESSPSGHGVRILFTVPDGFQYNKARYFINNQKAGLEIYIAGHTSKYVTVTGNAYTPGKDLEERGDQLLIVLERFMRRPARIKDEPAFCATVAFDDMTLVEKAKRATNGHNFSELMSGDMTGYKSRSEADLALCCMLAFWTGNDAERIDRIFRTSGLMREKWDRRQSGSTYGAQTVQKAIDLTETTYDPSANIATDFAMHSVTSDAELSKNVFDEFGFYSVPDLTDEEKRPPEFIVDGMIPCGMTFLSGAPKIRKSFFALQMAAAVATGQPFLGLNTIKCDVAYLDLEGSKSRVSFRADRMTTKIPRNVFITNSTAERLANGLVDKLRELHRQRPSIRLIIIDTYSRARGSYKAGGANAYDSDVALLEPIQRMALEENIAVVFVHHDKKGAGFAADSFERLSGTMGISGSSDAVLNLVADGKRFDGKATLEYTPRDARGGEMKLVFDERFNEWQEIVETPIDIRGNPVCDWIIANAPDRTCAGDFYSYQDAFQKIYRCQNEKSGDIIRKAVLDHRGELFSTFGIGVQTGVKYHGDRGIRIINLL